MNAHLKIELTWKRCTRISPAHWYLPHWSLFDDQVAICPYRNPTYGLLHLWEPLAPPPLAGYPILWWLMQGGISFHLVPVGLSPFV